MDFGGTEHRDGWRIESKGDRAREIEQRRESKGERGRGRGERKRERREGQITLLPALMPHICFLTSCTVQTLLTRCGVDGISMYSTYVSSPASDGRIVVEFTSCSSCNVCHCVFVPTLRPITLCADADNAAAVPAMALDTQGIPKNQTWTQTQKMETHPLTCQVGAQGSPTEMESDTAQKAEDDRRVVGAEIKSRDVIDVPTGIEPDPSFQSTADSAGRKHTCIQRQDIITLVSCTICQPLSEHCKRGTCIA
jgi:hypothetical protein